MKSLRAVVTMMSIALLATPLVASAQGYGGGPGGRHGRGGGHGFFGPGGRDPGAMIERLDECLDLSDEQRAKIDEIVAASRPAVEALQEQIASAREAFRNAHQPGDFDEAALRAHAEAQSALHVELMMLRAKTRAEIGAVLTPEQQAQLAERREQMKERRHERRCGGR